MATPSADRPIAAKAKLLGEALRRYRQSAGLSLAELAREVHYSRGYLSKVETGRSPGNVGLAVRCDEVLVTGGVLAVLAQVRPGQDPEEHGLNPRPGSLGKTEDPAVDPGSSVSVASVPGLPFLLSLDGANSSLRSVAVSQLDPAARRVAANRAVHDSGLYVERERLIACETARLIAAGESAFLRLVCIRDVVRVGAGLNSAEYHDAYHPFAEALWALRMAVRAESGRLPLSPALLGRADWSDRERCDCVPA